MTATTSPVTPVVTAPLSFTNGRPFVEVTLGGKGPFRFMIETGCDCISISPQVAAAAAGLEALTDDDLFRVGETRIDSLYRVSDLRIGGARLADFTAGVDIALGVDGILGLPAFTELLLTLDYPRSQLRLEKGELPPPDGKQILAVRPIVGPFLGFDLMIGGKPVPSIIDTQSGLGLSLSTELAETLRFESEPVQTGSVLMGGVVSAPVKTGRLADDIRIGEFTLQKQLAEVISHPPDRPRKGNIGARILSHFTLTLDQKNRRVRFSREGSRVIPPPPPYRTFGLTLRAQRGGQVAIVDVQPGGPAAEAGLKAGDVVVRFGDTPAGALPVAGGTPQASVNAYANRGEPVSVEVLRQGVPATTTLHSRVVVP